MKIVKKTATFTRPNDTTPYSIGDLVANSTTAGSVSAMSIAFTEAGGFGLWLRSATLRKTQASITNASFRLWCLNAAPTVTNGDNSIIAGNFLSTVMFEPIQIDTIALLTGGGAIGTSMFDDGMLEIPPTAYFLLEALAAYTPAALEIFTLEITGRNL